jgi:hypothetical protein
MMSWWGDGGKEHAHERRPRFHPAPCAHRSVSRGIRTGLLQGSQTHFFRHSKCGFLAARLSSWPFSCSTMPEIANMSPCTCRPSRL